jgi:fatty-acyl-CoA synthase
VDAELIDGIPATAQNVLIVGSLPETAADHPRLSWTPYEHSVSNAVDGALQPSKSIQPDDPLVIAFTSGTTGKPKGAMLSHRNILFDAASQDYQLRLRHDDRGIVAAPMCWTGGLMLITQPFLLRGLPITIIRKWNPSEVVEAIAADGCTVFGGVPTLLGQLVKHLQASPKVGLHIRAILCGGGNHTRGFDASVMQTLQPELYVFCYGMTESTGPLLYTGETEITLEKELALGYPAWHVEHQLRNGDGSEVERGEPGELVVRGPTISQGYFGQGSEGDSPFADGWFRTGDILRTGADGCLYFVDRAKDMIKSGGINVFAAEVEQAILAAFRDVVDDVAVVAAPSTTWGEAVVAFVKPRAGGQVDTALVASALRGMIAPYKIPKQVFTVEDVPRNFSGKIDKMELRSRLTQVDIG